MLPEVGRGSEGRVLMARRVGCILVLSTFLAACPSGSTGSGAKSSGEMSAEGSCQRSLKGDIKTIRSRLERERTDEAAVYVDALESCHEAQSSTVFLVLAAQVHEELGRLNSAWSAAAGAMRLVLEAGDDEAIQEIKVLLDRFRQHYVRIVGGGPSAVGPRIRYAGPVLDEVTFAQLAEVVDNHYVELGPGSWGFWVYPGRYEIDGVPRMTKPGDEIDLSRGGN